MRELTFVCEGLEADLAFEPRRYDCLGERELDDAIE